MTEKFRGQVEGLIVAKYRKSQFTYTCKLVSGTDGKNYYSATFHNGRQTNSTTISDDARVINNIISGALKEGYKREF